MDVDLFTRCSLSPSEFSANDLLEDVCELGPALSRAAETSRLTDLSLRRVAFPLDEFREFVGCIAAFDTLTRFVYDCNTVSLYYRWTDEMKGIDNQSHHELAAALQRHTGLRELDLSWASAWSTRWNSMLIEMSGTLTGLRSLRLYGQIVMDVLTRVIDRNTSLTAIHCQLRLPCNPKLADRAKIDTTLSQNWSLLNFNCDHVIIDAQVYKYIVRNHGAMWRHQMSVVLDVCIAMLPLKLTPYVLLWILEFVLPPTQRPDQHHRKIIRLIERIQCSALKR